MLSQSLPQDDGCFHTQQHHRSFACTLSHPLAQDFALALERDGGMAVCMLADASTPDPMDRMRVDLSPLLVGQAVTCSLAPLNTALPPAARRISLVWPHGFHGFVCACTCVPASVWSFSERWQERADTSFPARTDSYSPPFTYPPHLTLPFFTFRAPPLQAEVAISASGPLLSEQLAASLRPVMVTVACAKNLDPSPSPQAQSDSPMPPAQPSQNLLPM